MRHFISKIKRPVKRAGAEQYVLVTLLSFAASVTLTRIFLALTGYPQLGGGHLHIAHVLWGGLLLFAAALMPLIVANRWVYSLGAIFCGIGVGLFIDEVGKFITASNNYFDPLAAPIIYAFFLLTVLLYLQTRHSLSRDARAELYRALDAMEEVLDHDLDPSEQAELKTRLQYVAGQEDSPELARLADNLLEFLLSEQTVIAPERSSFGERLLERWSAFEARWISQKRLKSILVGGLFALSILSLFNILQIKPAWGLLPSLDRAIVQLVLTGRIYSARSFTWFLIRLGLEAVAGLLILSAGFLLLRGKENAAIKSGILGLLLSLTMVNLLVFYFEQFSTIIIAAFQFGVLIGLMYYRSHFIPHRTHRIPTNQG